MADRVHPALAIDGLAVTSSDTIAIARRFTVTRRSVRPTSDHRFFVEMQRNTHALSFAVLRFKQKMHSAFR
jgi:hypothetical protein